MDSILGIKNIESDSDSEEDGYESNDSDDSSIVCCSADYIQPIWIPELNLNFKDTIHLLNYLEEKITFDKIYYKLKLTLRSCKLELCFRNKSNLIDYFYNKFRII